MRKRHYYQPFTPIYCPDHNIRSSKKAYHRLVCFFHKLLQGPIRAPFKKFEHDGFQLPSIPSDSFPFRSLNGVIDWRFLLVVLWTHGLNSGLCKYTLMLLRENVIRLSSWYQTTISATKNLDYKLDSIIASDLKKNMYTRRDQWLSNQYSELISIIIKI